MLIRFKYRRCNWQDYKLIFIMILVVSCVAACSEDTNNSDTGTSGTDTTDMDTKTPEDINCEMVDCNDDNPCTNDECDPIEGCVYVPNTGQICDDDNAKTKSDTCDDSGTCLGVAYECIASQCETTSTHNGNDCDVEYEAAEVNCDDGLATTKDDSCDGAGLCAGTSYECTAGECDESSVPDGIDCIITLKADGVACDDADICTIADACEDGSCIGTPNNCADDIHCTDDGCDSVEGCQNLPNDEYCDDSNICTSELCDLEQGKCVYTPVVADCEDGTVCTANDSCTTEGFCQGDNINCDDNNECTADTCNPVTGCFHSYITFTACDDGEICTLNDSCEKGECVGQWNQCDDGNSCTDDSCDSDNGCVNSNNEVLCDDQDKCTADDVCTGGQCVGTPEPCPPSNWTCDKWSYGTEDGCDCGCGAKDPDCQPLQGTSTILTLKCSGEEQAANVACNIRNQCVPVIWLAKGCNPDDYNEGVKLPDASGSSQPLKFCFDAVPTPEGIPNSCDDSATKIEFPDCHCGCGVLDPDCNWYGSNDCPVVCPPGENCDNQYNCANSTGSCVPNECDLDDWDPNCGKLNGNDGCDCGCGCYDPDCVASGNLVTVDSGTCGGKQLPNPADPSVSKYSPTEVVCVGGEVCAPQGWLQSDAGCDPTQWNAGWTIISSFPIAAPKCNCSCGAYDPDCDSPLSVPQCPFENSNCESETGHCMIEGWTCPSWQYDANDGCHCDCGIPDPDCQKSEPVNKKVYCGLGAFDKYGNSPTSDAYFGPTAMTCTQQSNQCIPKSWTCAPENYHELAGVTEWTDSMNKDWLDNGKPKYCDCECGVVDPDCHIVPVTIGDPVGYSNCLPKTAGGDAQQCGLTGPVAGKCFSAYESEPPTWEDWNDGKVCDCGKYGKLQDPDCDIPNVPVAGCPAGYSCVDGQCNDTWGRVKMIFIHGRNDNPPPAGFEYWRSGPTCDECPYNPACYEKGQQWCQAMGDICGECTCEDWPGGCDVKTDKEGKALSGSKATYECCSKDDPDCPTFKFKYDTRKFKQSLTNKYQYIQQTTGEQDSKEFVFTRKEMCDIAFINHAYVELHPEYASYPASDPALCSCSDGFYLYGNICTEYPEAGACKFGAKNVLACLGKGFDSKWLVPLIGTSPVQKGCEVIQPGVPSASTSHIRALADQCAHIRAESCGSEIPLNDPWVSVNENGNPLSKKDSLSYNVAVNWDGQSRIAWSQQIIVDALDKLCTGNSYCYVYTHSTGGIHIGNAIAQFGHKKKWNIVKVFQAASAEGGSEITDYGLTGKFDKFTPTLSISDNDFDMLCNSKKPSAGAPVPMAHAPGSTIASILNNPIPPMYPIDCDLRVQPARNLYDHDATLGVPFVHAAGGFPGAGETIGFTEELLKTMVNMPVRHDGALGYHSTCGCTEHSLQTKTCSQCNQWVGHDWELKEGGFLAYGHNGGMRRISTKWADKSAKDSLLMNKSQALYHGPGPWERWKAQLNYTNNTLHQVSQEGSGPLEVSDNSEKTQLANSIWSQCSPSDFKDGELISHCYDIKEGLLLIPWTHKDADGNIKISQFNAGYPGTANFTSMTYNPVCTLSNLEICSAGSPVEHLPGPEVCDCVDNDFDGSIDEELDCSEAPACN